MLNVASDVHMNMSKYFAAYNTNFFLVFNHFSKFWHFRVAEFSAAIGLDLSFLLAFLLI